MYIYMYSIGHNRDISNKNSWPSQMPHIIHGGLLGNDTDFSQELRCIDAINQDRVG